MVWGDGQEGSWKPPNSYHAHSRSGDGGSTEVSFTFTGYDIGDKEASESLKHLGLPSE